MKVFAISLFAAVMMGLLSVWALAPRGSAAQTGDYDSDDDGLIEIHWLEQLNAVRWDLNGDGEVDSEANQNAYAAAFPGAVSGMGCAESGCVGYELARDLDFDDAGSYASGVMNVKWTEGVGWLPIGLIDNAFRTTFEGNEHTIANLYIKRSGLTDPGVAGLFGSSYGSISRTGLIGVDVSSVEHVGGLAGHNRGEINDAYSIGSVSGDSDVGGLVGSNEATISDSYATGDVSGDSDVGGLVGSNEATISDSYATGDVSGDSDVGGLVGVNYGTINISHATGSVSGDSDVGGLVGVNRGTINISHATGSVSGGRELGGLVGWNWGAVSTSYATGSVSGNEDVPYYVGGLVGWNWGAISTSYATGSVSGDSEVGGLVGENSSDNATIFASYAMGNVSGNQLVGGLVGINDDNASIYTSYTTGNVLGNTSVGGLLGRNSSVIDTGYWDTQTTGQSLGVGEGSSDGVVGKTTAELQAPTGYTGIYAGWLLDFDNADGDFDDTTGVDDFWDFGTASQYPALKADFDGDGMATWEEFGDQRGQSPAPASTPIPIPTPSPQADLELTMLVANYFGIPFYYMVVENNGPSDATEVALTDSLPEGVSSMLSIPVSGTCSGERTVVCELGDLAVGSKNLVMIIARVDVSLSQSIPVNTASVSAIESDPYPANNEASR